MPPRNSLTPMSDPRFSVGAWKKYELIVGAWLNKHPDPFTWNPHLGSLVTHTARIRDAVKGALQNNYHSDKVNMARLREEWPRVVVTIDEGKIRIGLPVKIIQQIEAVSPDPKWIETVITVDTSKELAAALLLLNNEKIKGQVRAPLSLQPTWEQNSNSFPNVFFLTSDSTHFTLH